MKPDNIDSHFRKLITESSDFFNTEAESSKERIWQQVELKKESNSKVYLIRLLAAACILLLLTTFTFTILNFRSDKKITRLVEINSDLQKRINNIDNKLPKRETALIANTINKADTVYIEKLVTITTPVIKTEHITDTIYIEQRVFIEKEQPEKLITKTNNEYSKNLPVAATSFYEPQILISNKKTAKPKKKRKLQFKFGGNKTHSNDGSLALNHEL